MNHVDLSGWYFFVCKMKIVLHELIKQRSSDVTGRHYRPADAEISLGSLQLEETVEIQASFSSTIRWTTQSIYLYKYLFIYLFIILISLFIADEKHVSLHQLNELSFRATLQPLSATNQHTILHIKPGIHLETFISSLTLVSWFSHNLWINSLNFFIEIYIKQMN